MRGLYTAGIIIVYSYVNDPPASARAPTNAFFAARRISDRFFFFLLFRFVFGGVVLDGNLQNINAPALPPPCRTTEIIKYYRNAKMRRAIFIGLVEKLPKWYSCKTTKNKNDIKRLLKYFDVSPEAKDFIFITIIVSIKSLTEKDIANKYDGDTLY